MKRLILIFRITLIAVLLLVTPTQALIAPLPLSSHWEDSHEEDEVSFDTLLASDAYTVYVEVRNLGRQARPGGLVDLLEPMLSLFQPVPKEVGSVLSFITENSQTLSRSRAMIALMPAKRGLPSALFALELSSDDAAKELEPHFKNLIASMMGQGARTHAGEEPAPETKAAFPIPLKREGSLLILSSEPFATGNLRGKEDRALSADPIFSEARARFSSEALFIFYNVKLADEEARKRREEFEETMKARPKKKDDTVSLPPPEPAMPGTPMITSETQPPAPPPRQEPVAERREARSPATAAPATEVQAAQPGKTASQDTVAVQSPPAAKSMPPSPVPVPSASGLADMALGLIFGGMASGLSKSVEAIALGLGVETDAFALRVQFVAAPEDRANLIPMLPLLASGPALTPAAADYLPDDTEVLITASLDLPQIYESGMPLFESLDPPAPYSRSGKNKQTALTSRIHAIEKKYKFKMKEYLTATLGNEVAAGLTMQSLFTGPSAIAQQAPIFLLAVQDKEALLQKLPVLLELLGLKAAGEAPKSEKRGTVTIQAYAKGAYTILDNYLILSPNVAAVRRAVEAHADGRTLINKPEFAAYTRWQPRQVLAQLYISSELMKGMITETLKPAGKLAPHIQNFLLQFTPSAEPIAYAASQETLGPVHELRLPKNLITLFFLQMAISDNQSRIPRNHMMTQSALYELHEVQVMYKSKHGRYGTLEELESDDLIMKGFTALYEYKIDLFASGDRYTATAVPETYDESGRLSFFIDETGILRGADHQGKAATAADPPIGDLSPTGAGKPLVK